MQNDNQNILNLKHFFERVCYMHREHHTATSILFSRSDRMQFVIHSRQSSHSFKWSKIKDRRLNNFKYEFCCPVANDVFVCVYKLYGSMRLWACLCRPQKESHLISRLYAAPRKCPYGMKTVCMKSELSVWHIWNNTVACLSELTRTLHKSLQWLANYLINCMSMPRKQFKQKYDFEWCFSAFSRSYHTSICKRCRIVSSVRDRLFLRCILSAKCGTVVFVASALYISIHSEKK